MSGFVRNIVFSRVNGASVAEKSWLACAAVAGVVALAGKCFQTVRAVELMVPGDFFSSLMLAVRYPGRSVQLFCSRPRRDV